MSLEEINGQPHLLVLIACDLLISLPNEYATVAAR